MPSRRIPAIVTRTSAVTVEATHDAGGREKDGYTGAEITLWYADAEEVPFQVGDQIMVTLQAIPGSMRARPVVELVHRNVRGGDHSVLAS